MLIYRDTEYSQVPKSISKKNYYVTNDLLQIQMPHILEMHRWKICKPETQAENCIYVTHFHTPNIPDAHPRSVSHFIQCCFPANA